MVKTQLLALTRSLLAIIIYYAIIYYCHYQLLCHTQTSHTSLALWLPQPLALELQLPLLILLGCTCQSGWQVTPSVEDVYRASAFS